MSAQIRAVLAEERAREPAIAPCPAMPLLSDDQCEAMDWTGDHLDCELTDESPSWFWPLGVVAAVLVTLASIAAGPVPWF